MKVFAIGDLHLSGQPPTKPMTIFGPHWDHHWERIQAHWREHIELDDLVFLVGDISWAMRLSDAQVDLDAISALPGKKFMIRGNHDYWWTSLQKMNALMEGRITFLQGRGLYHNSIAFGGTKGYIYPQDPFFKEADDRHIYERELMRTKSALDAMETAITESGDDPSQVTRILLLHYPPTLENHTNGFTDLLEQYHVDHCVFGHLHDKTSFQKVPSHWGQTQLHLVSADAANFMMKEIP